jgi:cell division protease FtsH
MKDKKHVELDDLEEARDKVRWGRAKRSRVMDEADKRIGAYHEAGHALMSLLLQPDVEPLHKVSIIPRGMALGATMFLPEKDRLLMKRRECIGNIKVSLAGRLSEELFCGDISSGAANDIRQGTELARRMVMEWGMSEKLGPIRYSAFDEAGAMWPAELGGSKEHSDATAREIDEEIRCIFDECYQDARRLLTENGEKLKRIAEALLQYEVLDADDVRKAIEGEPIDRPSPEEVKSSAESAEAGEQEPEATPVDASQEEAGPADDQATLGPEGEGARAPEGPE